MSQLSDERRTAPAPFRPITLWALLRQSPLLRLLLAVALTLAASLAGLVWVAAAAALLTVGLSLHQLLPPLWQLLRQRIDDPPTARIAAVLALVLALVVITLQLGWWDPLLGIYRRADWEAIGAIGEGVIGAFGQILVASVALMIAWRQVMVDQRLTTQQNRITQAQTIDSFIHGVSELISDDEGLLEDWPLERMLAEGRLAAVLSSIDADGKARILRFLSHARLLTPLRRDHRLGRAILDGQGSYEEDRVAGVPVIQLYQSLRGQDLAGTDLRGIDFNGADLRGTNLEATDLSDANLAGADLGGACLEGARLERTRFFYGPLESATPRQIGLSPDFLSGRGTGALVENINLTGVRLLDPEARHYLAAWSGKRSRQTLPGGCKGLPDRLALRAEEGE
ncbi:pentapeptide repeat-containing protein [Synechococcus sp. CBW1107]|uniref:pentapeptide repeat-containing protein n=1 Tax=Synechococcus sp. CBW1107 TaxID=2789857 RepID=UPI002AD220E6|nr:pentapeptide repeat-containing protein [Synechococcus sp. CBW1107]CAK6688556.1 hypothetical protein IFHNHDMJ_00426 [Synechococcus sp. CBW1107]